MVAKKEKGSQGVIVGNGRFKLLKKIGAGGAGELHLGEDLKLRDQVAVKLENLTAKDPQLAGEYKTYKIFAGGPGIAGIRYYGKEKQFTVMVMDLLDKSLEQWFKKCGKIFSLKTVAMLSLQVFDSLKFIHNKKYIHRDIKPENFLTGTGKNNKKVYIIDFGIAVPYVDAKGKHKPFGKAASLMGTARYTSINVHLGNESSRRDDLEIFGYVIIYFAKGSLPWQNIEAPTLKERFEKLSAQKQKTSLKDLCSGLPREFEAYMKYVKSLKFEQEPEYKYCNALFAGMIKGHGWENDGDFDWMQFTRKDGGATEGDFEEDEK